MEETLMKKYYARYNYGAIECRWIIYKKRKFWFNKKVSKFYSTPITCSKDFEHFVKPELERLEAEE